MLRPASLLVCVCALAIAQDSRIAFDPEQIPGPASPAQFDAWLADIRHWRSERRIRIGYDGSQYDRPELRWSQSSFIQPQMMIEDRYFYDPVAGHYTVDRYLDDLKQRYGGIDSVLIWHTYPNIGLDDRNQNDLLRDMPGGIKGVRKMVDDFHRRGVRVLFPIMLWDQGTRDEGKTNWDATASLFADINVDGLNGDTLAGVPRTFREASDKVGHPLVLEPEGALASDELLAWNNMSWGYWKYPFIPEVSRSKWLETRHMVNVCRRWARDKNDDLQYAFFNGVGYESWENIWGIWNGLAPRDAEALRRIATIERSMASILTSPDWEPHTPVLRYGIFSSKFPSAAGTLWTLVNRNEYDVEGRQIQVRHEAGRRYFDLWNGVELQPETKDSLAILSFPIEAHGYGALLELSGAPPKELASLLTTMSHLAKTRLQSLSPDRRVLEQQVVAIAPTTKRTAPPEGMVRIPGGDFLFEIAGIEIEGSDEVGVDVQYPWEDSPRRYHSHRLTMPPFYMDRYPVTNAEFRKFMDATHYAPSDGHNFLKHWVGGTYPSGWAGKPVTWVSIEDARAYARWAGKRLPHEWEWQYAAQSSDGRTYPWGNEWNPEAVPVPDKGRVMAPPADVNAHPSGKSPAGVEDLVGNVWQWTDEYVDDHTRGGILRGGSHYQPAGSHWYFPQAYKLNEHGKYLLVAPSKDRSGAVGFRCVADAQ
jgi:iron(II)-dependent oxidoreductase